MGVASLGLSTKNSFVDEIRRQSTKSGEPSTKSGDQNLQGLISSTPWSWRFSLALGLFTHAPTMALAWLLPRRRWRVPVPFMAHGRGPPLPGRGSLHGSCGHPVGHGRVDDQSSSSIPWLRCRQSPRSLLWCIMMFSRSYLAMPSSRGTSVNDNTGQEEGSAFSTAFSSITRRSDVAMALANRWIAIDGLHISVVS
jgi:hypothetical protein